MNRFAVTLGLLVASAVSCLLIIIAMIWISSAANSHEPYERYAQVPYQGPTSPYDGLQSPRGGSCCGGSDCAVLVMEPGVLVMVEDGYQITLTLEQARKINPYRQQGTSFTVTWDQVQDSFDGNFHLCIPNGTDSGPYTPPPYYCFWAPPST